MFKKIMASAVALVMMFGLISTQAFAEHHEAMVRVIHASPDAPAVDIYVNGEAVVEGAEYKQATDYMALPAGDHKIEVFPAGKNGEGDPVISQNVTLEEGMKYSAAAVGKLDGISLWALGDEAKASEGKAKVRVVHASPDAPNVDVAVKDGDVLFSDVAFKSMSDYAEVDPMTVDLEVRPAGSEDVVLEIPGVELKEGYVYSVYAIGLVEGEQPLEAWPLVDSANMPSEMPKTGMGGTADQSNNMVAWTLLGVSMLAVAGTSFYIRKKKTT
ncbi:DUF4397 domain-containing protein [Guptibacillus algicola]|uniref:DUF4397 domain-containing protein n=1 Tax=Guptibacillus algicola TaxID=225844 RepID=UPI001CD60C77|nr:DUF4397 domain-containing protein [Alkalihalobacillus algicola]MCA0989393.1 DUF4397 domain-containing protein [Alkalihalobacillus algicola]